jgi:hypothetical protein
LLVSARVRFLVVFVIAGCAGHSSYRFAPAMSERSSALAALDRRMTERGYEKLERCKTDVCYRGAGDGSSKREIRVRAHHSDDESQPETTIELETRRDDDAMTWALPSGQSYEGWSLDALGRFVLDTSVEAARGYTPRGTVNRLDAVARLGARHQWRTARGPEPATAVGLGVMAGGGYALEDLSDGGLGRRWWRADLSLMGTFQTRVEPVPGRVLAKTPLALDLTAAYLRSREAAEAIEVQLTVEVPRSFGLFARVGYEWNGDLARSGPTYSAGVKLDVYMMALLATGVACVAGIAWLSTQRADDW